MKKYSLFLIFALFFSTNLHAEEVVKTITIIGVGEISVSPDLAILNLSVESNDETYNTCIAKLNKKTLALKKALAAGGCDKENIKTTAYRINKEFKYDNQLRKSVFSGYKASHALIIRFKNEKEKIDKVFNALGSSLAEVNFNLNFDISNRKELKEQLIELAIKDAKKKANDIENYAGIKLGKIIDIQYQSNTHSPYVPARGRNMEYSSAKMLGAPADFSPGELDAEDIKLSDNVRIVWELK